NECDTSNNVATATDSTDVTVAIAATPDVTLTLAGDNTCVQEDSTLANPDNVITVKAGVGDASDELTQVVITRFQKDWTYELDGLKTAGVDVAKSDFDNTDGKITIVFDTTKDVQSFNGTIAVQPPADSDIDHPTLTATVTSADQADNNTTATDKATLDVHVD